MYDIIKVKEDILGLPKGRYQTKDLENFLFNYHLNLDGRLILEVGHYENGDETQNWFGKVIPITKFVLDEMKDTKHHGRVVIYGNRTEGDEWVDFHLRFADGNLTEVKEKIWITDANGDWRERDG